MSFRDSNIGEGHCEAERRSLELLIECRVGLEAAINSLGGKSPNTMGSYYIGYLAKVVNRATSGYILLRENFRVDASKFLVRPALETIFILKAVSGKPELLFRRFYKEWKKEKNRRDAAGQAQSDAELAEAENAFRAEYPGITLERKELKILEAAEAAGMKHVYDAQYDFYCQYTHGSFLSVEGPELDELTDPHETNFMTFLVIEALMLLRDHTPAQVPNLDDLKNRLLTVAGPLRE